MINDNLKLVKQIGRINNIVKNPQNNNSIEILVLKEKLSLEFTENIDLISQRESILQKMEKIKKQIDGLNIKLKNKDYVKKAPKELVQNDKKLVKELSLEDEKLRSIVSSIN